MEGLNTPIANKALSMLKRGEISASNNTPVAIPDSPYMNLLGMGTGVSVYSLERGSKNSPWAVKRVSKQVESPLGYQERLASEAVLLRRLNHPNVVGFRAYVEGHDGRPCLAMEECETSLNDLIEARSDKCYGPFEARPCLRVANDIARALNYLHTEAHILHGDVKSHNVLVKGDFEVAKLCDFGVCVPINADGMMDEKADCPGGGYVGTECWNAPELLDENNRVVSTKADMFAFGLTLWEMLSLCVPHMEDYDADISTDATEQSFNEESFIAKIGTRPPLTTYPLEEDHGPIVHIFNWCTEADYKNRPSAKEVVDYLKQSKPVEPSNAET